MTMRFFYSFSFTLAALFCAAAAYAQVPAWTTAWSIGVPGREYPTGIGLDAERNLYLTGYNINPEPPNPSQAITQTLTSWGPDGTQRWTRNILAGAPTTRAQMTVDLEGNVYVAASFNGEWVDVDFGDSPGQMGAGPADNLVVLKYNSRGIMVWHLLAMGNDSLTVNGIAVSGGNVWLAGTYTGSAVLGNAQLVNEGASDMFIAVLDTGTIDGDHGFFRGVGTCGGVQADRCHGVAAAPGGGAMILGEFSGTMYFGADSLTANGPVNFFLTRWRSDGAVAWGIADGGPSYLPATRFTPTPLVLTTDSEGNSYVGISYLEGLTVNGTEFPEPAEADAVLLQYRPQGTPAWAFPFPGPVLQLIQGIATDAEGGVYVSGFDQSATGTAFVQKLASDGEPVWEVSNEPGGGLGSADGGPICAGASNNLYLAGNFAGRTRFGSRVLTSEGSSPTSITGSDIYIARLGGPASSVDAADVFDAARAPFMLTQQEGTLLLRPLADAPAILEAGLYSMLGGRVAVPVNEGAGNAGSIRFDIGMLARGTYFLHVRTARGGCTRPVVIGR